MIKEGEEAPDFCLPDYNGEEYCLKDFHVGGYVENVLKELKEVKK